MKLKVNRHHLAISTPLQHQVGSIESSLRHWADEQLPLLLAQRLDNAYIAQGYTCIKSLDVNFQLIMRSGMMPTDFDLWIDQIVDGLAAQLHQGNSDIIRQFDNESHYLASFCLHVLQYGRAADWPFESIFNANLSVAENLFAQLQQKVKLLPQVIERLQQSQTAAVINLFNARQSTQLLYYCGKPQHLAVAMSGLYLAQQPQFVSVTQVLVKLTTFQFAHIALVLALVGSGDKTLPLDESQWQGIDNLAYLLLWLDKQPDEQAIKRLLQGQFVATDFYQEHLRLLYQLSWNSERTKALFLTQLHIAVKLLAEVKPQSKAASSLVWFETELGAFSFAQSDDEHTQKAQDVSPQATHVEDADDIQTSTHINLDIAQPNSQPLKSSDKPITESPEQEDSLVQHSTQLEQQVDSLETSVRPAPTEPTQQTLDAKAANEMLSESEKVAQRLLLQPDKAIETLSAADLAQVVLPRTEGINFAGMCLVLGALRRHPAAPLLSMEALWLLCCYAVPSDKRPLAFSDSGLRLMCFGAIPWIDGQVIMERAIGEHNFKQFCSFIQVSELEQLHPWVLSHLASFMTGFEQSTSDNIIRHFVDFAGKVTVMKKAVYSELHKPPLAIIVSMSPLFNQQSPLAAWPDRPWFIKWKD